MRDISAKKGKEKRSIGLAILCVNPLIPFSIACFVKIIIDKDNLFWNK